MAWLIANPISGDFKVIERFPFLVGGGDEESPIDFRVPGAPGHFCYLDKAGAGLQLCLAGTASSSPAELNTVPFLGSVPLKKGQSYGLWSEDRLLSFAFHENPETWASENLPFRFFLTHENGQREGPWGIREMERKLAQVGEGAKVSLADGASFRAGHFSSLAGAWLPGAPSGQPAHPVSRTGEYLCPHCGESFAAEDVLAVAVHESQRGDGLLGPDQMLRFKPTKTDGERPLDVYGNPCPDLACPHCHQKLPPEFLRAPGVVFSLVGGQRAGKSYFLAVLADRLPTLLANKTDLRWENHDPEGNMNLENYKDRILGAKSPEQAAIEKTVIGGITYREVHKGGREIPMPVPFHYRVCREGRPPLTCTFYDNAGEHFTPTESVEKNPGSLHVARADAILFLFDPLQSPKFVHHMLELEVTDPQLNQPMPDLQEVILAEMKTRIKRVKNLGPDGKLDVPVAFLVGKYDAWKEMIREEQRGVDTEILKGGKLCLQTLQKNSDLAWGLMKVCAPAVLRNAEALASNIVFFPVSTFGHNAVNTVNGKGFAPDPRKIDPVLIEAPFLWILSQIRPDLISTC